MLYIESDHQEQTDGVLHRMAVDDLVDAKWYWKSGMKECSNDRTIVRS